jgi:hypothetical protein
LELATREALGIDAGRELEAEADRVKDPDSPLEFVGRAPTLLDRALRLEIKALKAEARERVEGKPALQPYRDTLYRGVEWNFDDVAGYWRWVATAPIEALVEWAKECLDDEAAQAQADIERAIGGDMEAARRIREMTEGGA